ncbi:glycosyltransferase [Geomicrobium sp. JCM 19039]|uniref:glycosyltransferase family protein n=1 Tax=Geomicrobium sp. JCM 19039 TaxID=1460636 RepID=UPI00045F2131|nr:glycosyltransferase [Geomicrobium sp. JCM 19039]GAK12644.1 hypothetical protein JCM19039_2436 [Geomicrobium sp. JCM 19039]
MKVLYIGVDTSQYVDRNYSYIEQALNEKCEQFAVWRTSGHIQWILSKVTFEPDYILVVNDIGPTFTPKVTGLNQISIPCGIIVNDVHRFTEVRKNYLLRQQFDQVFSVVSEGFQRFYPDVSFEWLPHFVNTDVFSRENKKDIDLLLTGAVSETYPFRQHTLEQIQHVPAFVHFPHPGYKNVGDHVAGVGYAKQLQRAKISFACPSVYEYPVKKYFEIPASGTLLVAPECKDIRQLGFIPWQHYVPADTHTVKSRTLYYLANVEARMKIIDEAYRWVRGNHSLEVRVNELYQLIKEGTKKDE